MVGLLHITARCTILWQRDNDMTVRIVNVFWIQLSIINKPLYSELFFQFRIPMQLTSLGTKSYLVEADFT